MDYTITNPTFGFIGKLTELTETHPIGAASAFNAMHKRLTDVVSHLGGDVGVELVQRVVNLRRRIEDGLGENDKADYKKTLQQLRLQQDTDYFQQRGYVASQLLEGLRPEPFKDDNDLTLDQLKWIIPSLTEAQPTFSLEPRNGEEKEYTPELREAYALKLALSGIPEEDSECKFLLIQELTLARIRDCVPAGAMLGYWQALSPKNPTAKAIHATAEEVLISLPCKGMSETIYLESGLLMLEALSETVVSASKDWETRILSQQSTEYILSARKAAEERIQLCMSHASSDLSHWKKRCDIVIGQIDENLAAAKQTEICKHFQLGVLELSPYGADYIATSENAYLALAAAN